MVETTRINNVFQDFFLKKLLFSLIGLHIPNEAEQNSLYLIVKDVGMSYKLIEHDNK